MLPCAVMTITGSSASTSLAARSTPMPSPLGRRRSDSTSAGWESRERGDRFGLVAGLDDVMALRLERELEHRAQRVLVFDEENRGRAHAPGRSQPDGTPARRASSSIAVIALRLIVDFLLDALELGQRRLAVGFDLRPLRRVVAIDEVGRQRVDAALQRVGEDLRAVELRCAPP